MARAMLVGCGCCARRAGELLLEAGWAVRGTTRREEGHAAIEAAGIQAVLSDPDRVGTIVGQLGDVTVLAWLLGSATGGAEQVAAVHGPRLESTLEKVVDTPVRGFLYEASGEADPALLANGAQLVREAGERWRIPVEIVATDRGLPEQWAADIVAATQRLIS